MFSSFSPVSIGVPQGSILGPLLFLFYINDLPRVSNVLSCVLFADDTTVYASGNDMVELARVFGSEIENISLWMRANALSLNVNKTYYMLFSNTRTVPPSDPQIILDGMNVRREQNCKFLGINIDTKLNFKFHISHVCGKIARSVGIFY